jgi:hypothetical protein
VLYGDAMTEGASEQGREAQMMAHRTAPWLAWSLMALSVALLVGGVALSHAAGSAVPGLPSDGETADGSVVANLVTLLPFSVVGAIVASRRPRNAIAWLFCGVGVTVGLNSLSGDYAEFWLASGFGTSGLGVAAAWFSSWLWILLVYAPPACCCCCSPTVGYPRLAGGPCPGASRSGPPAAWRATP